MKKKLLVLGIFVAIFLIIATSLTQAEVEILMPLALVVTLTAVGFWIMSGGKAEATFDGCYVVAPIVGLALALVLTLALKIMSW